MNCVKSSVGYKFLIQDLTINCESPYYITSMPWVHFMAVFYTFAIPSICLYFLYLLKSDLTLSRNAFDAIMKKVDVLVTAEIKIGELYLLLKPLETFYNQYKGKFWYLGIIFIVLRIVSISMISLIFVDLGQQLVVNIIFTMLLWFMQYRLRPCFYDLENTITELGCLQLFLSYLCAYVHMYQSLGPSGAYEMRYAVMDLCIIFMNLIPTIVLITFIASKLKDSNKIQASDGSQDRRLKLSSSSKVPAQEKGYDPLRAYAGEVEVAGEDADIEGQLIC
jgi:hypothetical protein